MEGHQNGNNRLLNSSTSEVTELFVWPWMGIVANIPVEEKDGRYVRDGGSMLKHDLAAQGFKPVRVHPLWNYKGHSGFAVVEFDRDWLGFTNGMKFEKCFEANHRGKKDLYAAKQIGDELYGWIARDDDFHSESIIGEHLRRSGDLKTISGLEAEYEWKTTRLVANLSNAIEVKNMRLKEIECKYNETSISVSNLMAQKEVMHRTFNEEIMKIQQNGRSQLEKILKEHEKIRLELESQSKELEKREKELQKQEARNENESTKLFTEKKMNEHATLEQKKADENLRRLSENQKKEKEKLHRRIIELQKKLDAKQALELEVQCMRGALQVLRHMNVDGGNSELKNKMDAIQQDLREKEQDLDDLESLNQALIVKERKSNDELQEARKELINVSGVLFS
ncbi:hypothetical protein U1Q18_050276 [Sarracenia purpurea var. burkii]